MIRLLVGKGADVKMKDFIGKIPLHYAVDACNYKLVKYFVEIGVDVNIKDGNDMTIFDLAINLEKTPPDSITQQFELREIIIFLKSKTRTNKRGIF